MIVQWSDIAGLLVDPVDETPDITVHPVDHAAERPLCWRPVGGIGVRPEGRNLHPVGAGFVVRVRDRQRQHRARGIQPHCS